jgi:hypothetical protein
MPGRFAQVIADQFTPVGYRAWARRLRAEAIYPVWA